MTCKQKERDAKSISFFIIQTVLFSAGFVHRFIAVLILAAVIVLILAAAISYSLWFYLLQRNDVGRISISKFLTPIFGVVFSGLLLNEPVFTPENGIALALVCAGIITVNSTARTGTPRNP